MSADPPPRVEQSLARLADAVERIADELEQANAYTRLDLQSRQVIG